MQILVFWAVINLGLGLFYSRKTTGAKKSFWQLTWWWNAINLSVGALAIAALQQRTPELLEAINTLKFNTALDAFYIFAGAILAYNSKSALKGAGAALLVQGSFLFFLDAAMVLRLSTL